MKIPLLKKISYPILIVFLCLIAGAMFWKYKNRNNMVISGNSMAPNLIARDIIDTDPDSYSNRPPEKGDIVVYHRPKEKNLISIGRIVGVPGDQISFPAGRLNVNGESVNISSRRVESDLGGERNQTYIEETEKLGQHQYPVWYLEHLPRTPIQTATVPEDQFYIAGDNRDNAYDSRIIGTIPRSQIFAQVKKIVQSKRKDVIGQLLK